ncbi:hypothetical protein ACWFMI_23235 [Nocardiopsis terrae]|uniref:hypothetical protein n=1 Tax=Streptomyces sp. NPDC057554 TaxID=3350538 RepID=UPI0036B693FC
MSLVEHLHPAAPASTRVTSQDVTHLDRTTNLLEQGDFLFGAGLSRAAVFGQLQHIRQLYQHASCTPQVRTELESALARIAKVTGWMAFDAGDMEMARPCWALGLAMAKRADNAPVTTSLLTDMARASIHHGDPREALQLLGMAAASALACTATLRTAHAAVTARAHGTLGAERDCRASIEAAHHHFAQSEDENEPEWMAFFDHAQLSGDTGQALVPLALEGHQHERAVQLLEQAVHAHTPEAGRALALSRAKLVRLHLASGDLEQARAITHDLVGTAALVRSARVHQDLRTIADDTVPFGSNPDASWVRHQVTHVLTVPGPPGV